MKINAEPVLQLLLHSVRVRVFMQTLENFFDKITCLPVVLNNLFKVNESCLQNPDMESDNLGVSFR